MGGGTTLTLWTLDKRGNAPGLASFFFLVSSLSFFFKTSAKDFLPFFTCDPTLSDFFGGVSVLSGDKCNLRDSVKPLPFPCFFFGVTTPFLDFDDGPVDSWSMS